MGHGSPEAGSPPVHACASPARQYGHLCKLHRSRAFPEETATFRPVADDSPYGEGPGHDDATGHSGEHCSSKEAGPELGSTCASGNLLAPASVWQLPRNRPRAHSCGDSLGAGPPPAQPRSRLRKVTDASQEVQNPRASAGRAAGHPPEARACGREESPVPSTQSPVATSCSGGCSRQEGPASDSEGSEESLPRAEEGLALNEALRRLRQANREQHAEIQSLRSSKAHLEEKVRGLQASAAKQRVLVGAIGQLKENVEALIEDKYRVMLEKNEMDHTLQNLHRVLAGTQRHLRESLDAKETLQLELKKVQASYVHLQEKYVAEVQPGGPPGLDANRGPAGGQREEAEAEQLRQLRGELARAASCTQHLLQDEKRAREQELQALQEALRQHQREDLEERQKVQARLERLGAQLRGLRGAPGPETHGSRLPEQEQVGLATLPLPVAGAQSPRPQSASPSKRAQGPPEEPENALDCAQDTEQPTEVPLGPSPGQEGSPGSPDTRRASQLAAKIHSVLGLMVDLLSCQGHSSPDADGAARPQGSERGGQSMMQKLKHLQLKKRHLEKELLKHKQRIMMFRKSIANSKAAQRQAQVTDLDSADTGSVIEVPVLLDTKLDEYHLLNQELDLVVTKLGSLLESKENHCHRLIEENDKYQRYLDSLIDKVTSYEEIIECADHRLAVSCSHITHLEERNRHLEDLIRRPGERARKLRLRGLEAQPRLAGRAGSRDGHCQEGQVPV
ncbi:cancer-associated gene 1 protein [Sorex fumeus]|uniref:cancer-associated gene 1 protein n=1 Tax=Sorex fumeus TaxID=62283 RepID=UPI0024AE2549|nr:cancer-associated gene 1 protein [Sorex fumeus]